MKLTTLTTSALKTALLPAATLALAIALPAQAVKPAQSTATRAVPVTTTTAQSDDNKSQDDDIIELSVFEVSAGSQTGYVANESMTGSRMPTKVIDLPFNIDFVTSEFFDDFAINDFSEIVEGGVMTFDQDAGNESMIRGIRANGQLFNGFWMPAGTPIPISFTDRTEVLKGPNAGIYGQTAPGGMINTVSKAPKSKPSQSVRVSMGNYNQINSRIESTGPIAKNTSYYGTIEYKDRKFDQPWRRNTTTSFGASLLHKFNSSTSLKVDITGALRRNDAPANRIPYTFDSNYKNEYYDPETGATASSTGRFYGLAWELADTSGTGSNSWEDTDTYSIFATLEKRINSVFSWRLGGSYTYKHSRAFNKLPLTVYDPDPDHADVNNPYSSSFWGLSRTQTSDSSFTAPRYDINNQDNGGVQGDILARYNLFGNKNAECRTLFTFDFSSRYQYSERWAMPAALKNAPVSNPTSGPSTQNAVDPSVFPWDPNTIGTYVNGHYISEQYFWANYWMPVVNPIDRETVYIDFDKYSQYDIYHVPDFNSDTYVKRSSTRNRRDVFGVMMRQQMILWQRAIFYASARFDNVTYTYETESFPSWSVKQYPQYEPWYHADYKHRTARWHSTAFKPSAGFNVRAVRGIQFYGNYSSSFNPSGQTVNGKQKEVVVLPNEEAWGYDYGVKFSLLNEKLTGTVGGFYISQKRISRSEQDPLTGESYSQAVGNILSRGMEANINYYVTRSLFVKAGYFHTNAKWIYAGADKDLQGRSYENVPSDIVTFSAKYTFQNGILKGLNFGAKYQHIGTCRAEKGKAFTLKSEDGDMQPVGYNSGVRDLMVPSVYLIDAFISYKFRCSIFGRKTTHSVNLNVKNVLDELYVTNSRGVGDGRTFLGTYSVQF
ncbi:TonB-dependent siderophore receptor [Ereboglobus luteus]|uniref:TonB-dependent receptor plug domain-containing protein n=1 Tax=Ereboglobus luteus TaxID=1796921 RepID=A0A2U8E473_9BACT|nr:TonB-dependent receptor [Ereboglobus luteus]AWI09709.1 hypothetical protein CKA38_11000 [Ereboglobus luteus]